MVSPSCSVKLDWVDGGWLLLFTRNICVDEWKCMHDTVGGPLVCCPHILWRLMLGGGEIAVKECRPAGEGLKEDWDSNWWCFVVCVHIFLIRQAHVRCVGEEIHKLQEEDAEEIRMHDMVVPKDKLPPTISLVGVDGF